MSDARIDSVLQEERQFSPPPDFARRARIKSAADLNALHARAAADHAGFWADLARSELTWRTPFQTLLYASAAPRYQWFKDGTLNVSHNGLDRHLASRGEVTVEAIV